MKTSKKILLFTAGILSAIFITGLMFFRSEVNALMVKAQLEMPYELAEVGKFYNLDFSTNWIVKIKQGRRHEVEVANDGTLEPKVENIHGTLYFKIDSMSSKNGKGNLYARITMPDLKKIKAKGTTRVELKNFQSDSLEVILEDQGVFMSDKNTIKHVFYKTSGEAIIEFIDDI